MKIVKQISVLIIGLMMLTLWACEDSKAAISTYTRDTASGTRGAFFEIIDFDEATESNEPLVGVTETTGNGDMIAKVENDENAIGYVSLHSLPNPKLTALQYNGVTASAANVINGTYKLARPFMYVTRDFSDNTAAHASAAEQMLTEAFVAFFGSKEGTAAIISSNGIVDQSQVSWATIKAGLPAATQTFLTTLEAGGSSSDTTFKLAGSTSVEDAARALTQAFASLYPKVKPEHNHTGSSDGFKRTQGSEKDAAANWAHIGFASRNFKDSEKGAANTQGKLADDAVVVVVNKANETITSITAEQLRRIYDGTYKTWSDIK